MNLDGCLVVLNQQQVDYALYFHMVGEPPVFIGNQYHFRSASIIKIPILLSWIELEKNGDLDRKKICNLDGEPQVAGAGFSRIMATRQIAFEDVLLMMIATSDNLCTNLVIKEIGLERLQKVMREKLKLDHTVCQRKLMDYAARDRGLDNWIDALECIRFYQLISELGEEDQAWVKRLLSANTDDALLKRNLTRDTVDFYHKTGSMTGVLHDWGFTESCELFLLTQKVVDEPAIFEVFGSLGSLILTNLDNESN
jgi:beta-lactamase class A